MESDIDMDDLKELAKMRETTRKAIAAKICTIYKYCVDNKFTDIIYIHDRVYHTAYNGLTKEMILIYDESDRYDGKVYEFEFKYVKEYDIDAVVESIRCNNEKVEYIDYNGYGTAGYYEPTIKHCKDWIDRKMKKLGELHKIELQELKEILKEYEWSIERQDAE